ncbi:MAG: SpoIIE family protein phosphatase [Acidobacteriota bacterium]|nr:MAG: SpoIIE family protein phosphatase [Acidobacteriota bacterium]
MSDAKSRRVSLTELIRSLMPITMMGKALAAGVIVWFINWVFASNGTLFGSRLLKTLVDLASVLALAPLFYFILRWVGRAGEGLLWRLRRRLVITYLLIGALPMLLVMLLIALIGYAVVMQSSAGLVSRQLDGYLEQSRAAVASIGRDLGTLDPSSADAESLRRRLQERANSLQPIIPELTLTIVDRNSPGPPIFVRADADLEGAPPDPIGIGVPEWLAGAADFHGLVVEDAPNRGRVIRARHIIRIERPRALILSLSYPVNDGLCLRLRQTTDLEVMPGRALRPLVMTPAGPQLDEDEMRELSAGGEPAAWPAGSLPIYKRTVKWATGKAMESDVLLIDLAFLLPGHIWWRVQQFKSDSAIGNTIFIVIVGLGILFLSLGLIAVISAVILTRSITRTVHDLYEGTKRVESGILDQEVPIKGRDQVAELSVSFNRMTRSIRELLRVSAEKERLDQEVRIASQVQSLLFPRSVPETAALDIAHGICIPARSVSGDYYDYFAVDEGTIGLVIADVCGKGVSAALMMANLQANLRSQVRAFHEAISLTGTLSRAADSATETAERANLHPVSRIVQRVNEHVSASMIDAGYITLCYAEFDLTTSILRYTNAGHNHPLLVRSPLDGGRPAISDVIRLEEGGTVLGLFPDYEYSDAEIPLRPGDVIAAFTDGLIEALGPANEEFGEERVIEVILANHHRPAADIRDAILETVKSWTSGAEQEDDLTLLVFKAV